MNQLRVIGTSDDLPHILRDRRPDELLIASAKVVPTALEASGFRFRHPARFRRWRPDLDARACTLAQLS